jgi:hypothetical protein
MPARLMSAFDAAHPAREDAGRLTLDARPSRV